MPRLCQNMTFSDILNPRITSTGTNEIVGNQTGLGCPVEYISVGKKFHKFLIESNVAICGKMEGDDNPCT